MGMKSTALALMFAAIAPAASYSQSLVVASNSEWTVSASYAYSQRYHADPWIQIDVGMDSVRPWTIRPHEAFHLLTPDGERIDLPDQRAFRRGFQSIQAMYARAATMQLSPWLALKGCEELGFADMPPQRGGGRRSEFCRTWRLWGNSDVDWTATVGPRLGGASLFFESPTGTWPAGQYTLVVSGPPNAPDARLPINLLEADTDTRTTGVSR